MPITLGVIGDAATAGRGTYDVLVVGAGPGGLATALSAARHGARVLVVDRRPGTSGLPRATGINVRTVEILRTWGVAPAVRARRIRVVPEAASAATLAAPPRSSGRAGGYPSHREILDVSPVLPLACPQDLLEPVLVDAVRRAGGEIRFATPLVGPARSGPTASVPTTRARLGSGTRVHARFVVGADGTRSTVRAALGIGTVHLGTWAHAVQVLFRPQRRAARAAPRRSPSSTSRTPRRCARWARAAGPTSACGSTDPGRPSPPTGRRRCAPPPGFPTSIPRSSTCSRSRWRPRSRRPTAPGPGSSSATPRTARPPSPGSA